MTQGSSPSPIPERLRRYVLTSVPSVAFVETMLVFRAEPHTVLSIDDISRRLYISEQGAALILEQLRAGLIIERSEGGHRYSPPSDLAAMLDELAVYYRSHLVEITALIHAHTGRAAQQFADAFKLRKG